MRFKIRDTVGRKGKNWPSDVAIVQDLLRRSKAIPETPAATLPFANWAGGQFGNMPMNTAQSTPMFANVDNFTGYYPGPQLGLLPFETTSHIVPPWRLPLPLDGVKSDVLIAEIEEFQRDEMHTKVVDGLVGPKGPTFARLSAKARLSGPDDLFGSATDTIGSTIKLDTVEKLFKLQIKDGTQDKAATNFRSLVQRIAGDAEVGDVRWAAYMLATTKIEAMHNFWPIKETGGDEYLKRKYDVEGANPTQARKFGNTEPGDGVKYAGRGFVQLTWKDNYRNLSKLIGQGNTLVDDPDKALEYDNAYNVMSMGMRKGSFTGVGLSRFINKDSCDYFNARKIINSTDRADDIAALAEGFEIILRLGLR